MFLDNGRNIERVRTVLFIYLIVMTVALLMPADWLPAWLRGQESMFGGWGAKDKFLHAGSFAALSFLGIRSLRGVAFRPRALIMLGLALIYGCVTEILQGVSGFRDFEALDLVADMLGAILGIGAGWILDRRYLSPGPVDGSFRRQSNKAFTNSAAGSNQK